MFLETEKNRANCRKLKKKTRAVFTFTQANGILSK